MGYQDRPRNPKHENIEFRNETEDEYNVVVCQSKSGKLYVHLLGDEDEFHDDEASTIPPQYYEIVPINEGKR